eukprot:jgi/Phyca11/566039/estExt2_Genewise1.C_PHYCAscaffold_200031
MTKGTKGLWLTINQKCKVIEKHCRCPSLTLSELGRWALHAFGLSHPPADATTFRVLRDAATIKAKLQTATTAKGRISRVRCPELEIQLGEFVMECQSAHVCLSRRLITKKAQRIMGSQR